MRRPPSFLFTLLGLLLFGAIDANCQFHSPEEAAAVKNAEEFALQAAREHADGFLESAERSAIESLRILPRRPHNEEKRTAYRKQLAGILEDLLATGEATRVKPAKPEAEYQPSGGAEDTVPFLLREALAVDKLEREQDDRSDVEDMVPYLGQYRAGTPPASREIRLPMVEFSEISLKEALRSCKTRTRRRERGIDREPTISAARP